MSASSMAWLKDAKCQDYDAEIFFPVSELLAGTAVAICQNRCPVRARCLAYALDNGETNGVWGGLTERQRRRARRIGMTAEQAIVHFGPLTILPEPTRTKPVKRGRPEAHDPTRPAYHRAEIIRRVQLGQSWSPIAAAIGCNPESVRAYIRRLPEDVRQRRVTA